MKAMRTPSERKNCTMGRRGASTKSVTISLPGRHSAARAIPPVRHTAAPREQFVLGEAGQMGLNGAKVGKQRDWGDGRRDGCDRHRRADFPRCAPLASPRERVKQASRLLRKRVHRE
jgi:hypothetical protein